MQALSDLASTSIRDITQKTRGVSMYWASPSCPSHGPGHHQYRRLYQFCRAFRTEPLLTYVRDQLGADYLNIFDLDWQPKGVLAKRHNGTALSLASTDRST